MRIFRIESGNGYEIREHGSTNVFLSPVVDVDRSATIHWMHFDPRGLIGGHYLTSPQIFLVAEGDGWVKSNNLEPIPVIMGDGVFWDTGEWHEAGSESGMNVILVESKLPDPAAFLARF
jgi:quercetin dioxygenase-like cupin family protein